MADDDFINNGFAHSSLKVLFVDDEKNVLRSLNRLFAEEEGMVLLNASNAQEALGLIDQNDIAVVVSDNKMPGMQGTELLFHVKEKSPETVTILMTAHGDFQTAVDSINRGCVFRFVVKPWDNDALKALVREAVQRFRVTNRLKVSDESNLLSLAKTIELKDPYTRGHCERVADYAFRLAETKYLSEEMKKDVRVGSWLHDCGKIGVPDDILNFPGKLNDEQMAVIKKHPVWGAEVAREANLSKVVVNIILYHHEQFRGGGYPEKLAGEEIPLEARIVSISDVYDALTSDRPYRKGHGRVEAFKIMNQMAADFFDPEIFDSFLELIGCST